MFLQFVEYKYLDSLHKNVNGALQSALDDWKIFTERQDTIVELNPERGDYDLFKEENGFKIYINKAKFIQDQEELDTLDKWVDGLKSYLDTSSIAIDSNIAFVCRGHSCINTYTMTFSEHILNGNVAIYDLKNKMWLSEFRIKNYSDKCMGGYDFYTYDWRYITRYIDEMSSGCGL